MKYCLNCGNEFPTQLEIEGKIRKFSNRKYCLDCSPFGANNSQRLTVLKEYKSQYLTKVQKEIINGHLLGDGYLSKPSCNNDNSQFCVKRKSTDSDYLLWTAQHFQEYLSSKSIHSSSNYDKNRGCYYHSIRMSAKRHPIFTNYYYKWYPEGKKIIPKDLILTPLTIAVWFADDGTIKQHNKHLQLDFCTDGFIYNDVNFLSNQLQSLYGPRIYLSEIRENQYRISIGHKETIQTIVSDINAIFPLERKSKIWQHYLL